MHESVNTEKKKIFAFAFAFLNMMCSFDVVSSISTMKLSPHLLSKHVRYTRKCYWISESDVGLVTIKLYRARQLLSIVIQHTNLKKKKNFMEQNGEKV